MAASGSVASDVKDLFRLSVPVISTTAIQQASRLICIAWLGRLGSPDYVGAAVLGFVVCNVTGNSLAFGFCTALDAFVSQAYGSRQYRLMGLYTQRVIAMMTIASVPVIFIWCQTEFVLHEYLFIQRDIAHLAGSWSKVIAIGLWPNLIHEILRKYLQGGRVLWPVLLSTLVNAVAVLAGNLLYVEHLGLGFRGVALAFVTGQWAALVALAATIVLRKRHLRVKLDKLRSKCGRRGQEIELASALSVAAGDDDEEEGGEDKNDEERPLATADAMSPSTSASSALDDAWSRLDDWPPLQPSGPYSVFSGWVPILQLGVPGAMSLCVEWGSFELVAGIAGQLGPLPLSVHGVLMNTASTFICSPRASRTRRGP